MPVERREVLGHLAAVTCILFWGMAFVSTKILLQDFTPVEILFFRFVLGYAALLIIYPHRLQTRNLREECFLVAAGICGITIYFLLENVALAYTFASNASVLIATAPLFTAILAHLLLQGERLRGRFLVGFFVAIIGISLITFNGSFILKLNPLGDFLAISAAAVWASYSVLMRKISEFGYNAIGSTRRVFMYGLIFILPAFFFFEHQLDFSRFAKLINLFNILFLGLGSSALCFVLWNWAIGVLGAVKTSFYIYASPVITVIASALVLRESITPIACIGILLTLAGLYVSEQNRKEEPDSANRHHKSGHVSP
jgi:drug/metabolite transporter (DMT)-like permease